MSNPISTRRLLLQLAVIASVTLAACGGGGGSTPGPTDLKPKDTQLNTVTPALGATYKADVYVYAADGFTPLGQGTTGGLSDTNPGKSNVTLSGYTAGKPVIVKVIVDPAKGASYYDENQPSKVSVTPASAFTMLSILREAKPDQDFSANPLTNMAAKFAGISVEKLGNKALTTPLTADKINEGVATTNLVLGLPGGTDITLPVTPVTQRNPTPSGTIGKMLVFMATERLGEAIGLSNEDPITRANKLVDAINTDGTINQTKISAFKDLNKALLSKKTELGIAINSPKTTDEEIKQALPAAKDAVAQSVTKFTGSTTGAN